MFEECVSPLIDGLLQGYNATVLAYGHQMGSGKTYTMGTGFKDGYQTGLIPRAMSALFNKIGSLQHQIDFQLHVFFIEAVLQKIWKKWTIIITKFSLGLPSKRFENLKPFRFEVSRTDVQKEHPSPKIKINLLVARGLKLKKLTQLLFCRYKTVSIK